MNRTEILVVEDDPTTGKMVKAKLEARDYIVLLAHNGAETIKILDEESPGLIIGPNPPDASLH
jgi:DNA-binding response OmpR family regulator